MHSHDLMRPLSSFATTNNFDTCDCAMVDSTPPTMPRTTSPLASATMDGAAVDECDRDGVGPTAEPSDRRRGSRADDAIEPSIEPDRTIRERRVPKSRPTGETRQITLSVPRHARLLILLWLGLVGRSDCSEQNKPAYNETPPKTPRGLQATSSVPCEDRTNFGQCKKDIYCLWEGEDVGCVTLPVGGVTWTNSTVTATVPPLDTPAPTVARPATPAPSGRPVTAPTTEEPTTAEPTTGEPTERPATTEPTERPTTSPSGGPSKRPSPGPTKAPTDEPTVDPSGSPTIRPTPPPTRKPTRRPTERPTKMPSGSPTVDPTRSPSRSPTFKPTDVPTDGPTLNPTKSARPTPLYLPSASPTVSSMPTTRPTSSPTAGPSVSPTGRPTVSPTKRPTPSPVTPGPTDSESAPTNPTESPLDPPTWPPTTFKPTMPARRTYRVPSLMRLDGVSQLSEEGEEAWIMVTENRIRRETEAIIGEDGEELKVTVKLKNQEVIFGRRMLIQNDEDVASEDKLGHLRRNFVTTIQFHHDKDDWDANEMVFVGFVTVVQQKEYLGDLKAADGASFGNVGSMALNVNGVVVTEVGQEGGNWQPITQDYTMYYIIGGTVGGGVVLLLVMTFLYKRRSFSSSSSSASYSHKSHSKDTMDPSPHKPPPPPPSAAPATATTRTSSQSYFGTIEPLEGPDDVSTLGDPYFGEVVSEPHADATVGESMISSEQQMYEYGVRRSRLNTGGGASTLAQSTVGGGTYKNAFADDTTLEGMYRTPPRGGSREEGGEGTALRHLTVVAPEGKLGIVVDNRTGDMPVVHAIKETSVLKGRLSVGDFLISVDEVDCRGMTAVQVSKLISNRSMNPARTLALLRGSGGC